MDNELMDGLMEGYTCIVHVHVYGWIDGWMDGWMDIHV